MKTNCKLTLVLGLVLVLSVVTLNAYAYGSYGKEKGKACHEGFSEKFFCDASFVMSKQEEMGLTSEQADAVKNFKINTKKDLIRKQAEIDLIQVDIKAELWKDLVDADAVNALIDKKYELKKEKAKYTVNACAALKSMLTEEQCQKMKQLCKMR